MKKAGFDNCIISFFANYLVDRKTNYFWNNFSSPTFCVNVGVGQGSALLPILSALYLLPFIYILEKRLKNLKISISIISFVDDGLFISQRGGNILQPNDTWKYLGFIFNRKLIFHQHVDFYTNKLISTIKCMKIISNSNCGINPSQKHLLYRSCILPIALYSF